MTTLSYKLHRYIFEEFELAVAILNVTVLLCELDGPKGALPQVSHFFIYVTFVLHGLILCALLGLFFNDITLIDYGSVLQIILLAFTNTSHLTDSIFILIQVF